MRQLVRGGLWLVSLTGTLSGCDLQFIDIEVEERSRLGLSVYTVSDQDSIRVNGGLHRGLDETGRVRSVLSGLQIGDEVLPPDVTAESGWAWDRSVPVGVAADGRLTIHPPVLDGLDLPQPIDVSLPDRVGPNRLEIVAGEPITLRYAHSPTTPYGAWWVRLVGADGVIHYSAQSRNPLSGELVIPGELLPSSAPGPYLVELDLLTETPSELDEGQYGVRIQTVARLTWVIERTE